MKPKRIKDATREQLHPTHGSITVLDIAHRIDAQTVTRKLVTEWAPTKEELGRLNRGASILLGVVAPTLPVVDLWVGEPPPK